MRTREQEIIRTTAVGSVVNVLLTGIKFLAGVVGHSSAMIADAVHSLSDLISDAIVLVFVKISGKPEDGDHAYGHGKYETLATVIIGLILLGVGVGLLVDGVGKTIDYFNGAELEMPNWWALGAALFSLVSKEGLFQYTIKIARKTDSSVLEANAWHHRSDAYTSVATLAGIGGAMLLGANWRILDPLAAAFVSVFIIIEALKLIKPALDELLEKSLPQNKIEEIEQIIRSNRDISSFHRLRTRKVGSTVAISAHIKMPGDISLDQAHDIASKLENDLKSRFGRDTIISIHMEPERGNNKCIKNKS